MILFSIDSNAVNASTLSVATVTIRNLDESVKQGLRLRAAERGCSMEAEARSILTDAVAMPARPTRSAIRRVQGRWAGRVNTDEVMGITRGD